MIPKIIHYCWFGRNPKSLLAIKCIKSWKKYCPDYEIIEWNEDNFDISAAPLYVRQAYEMKKWAFVTDYVRLYVVYEHGGIYMDTDVELKKCLTSLLHYNAYFGFENKTNINTGLGFGAAKNAPVIHEMLEMYRDIPFLLEDGEMDLLPCPVRNTEVLLRHGLVQNDKKQVLDDKVLILPSIYLCPYNYTLGVMKPSFKTISVHWFEASWQTAAQREQISMDRCQEWFNILKSIRYQFLNKVLGEERYISIKKWIKGDMCDD